MTNTLPSADEVDRQIEAEFRQDVEDTLGEVDVLLGNLRSNSESQETGQASLHKLVHNLLVQGRGINIAAIDLLAHRLAEYLNDVQELTPANLDDVQTFIDKFNVVLDGDVSAANDTPSLVRELPTRPIADIDFGDITPKDIEVLLIIPDRSMARIVEKELAECGYRVSNARSSFEGFKMALQTRPDMVISSMELSEMTGIDLSCAFAAMSQTHALPFALLTSYEWGNPALDRLPPRAALLRKGKSFGGDLADALARFRIT